MKEMIVEKLKRVGNCSIRIVRKREINAGVMMWFSYGDGISVAIQYDDGNCAMLRDWQGAYPETEEEIEDYRTEWIDLN